MSSFPTNKPQSQKQIAVTGVAYSGPVPDPNALEKYNQIVPGSADRLIKLAEGEAHHRREQEQKQLEANILLAKENQREAFRGQLCGFIIGMTALIVGAVTTIHGSPGAGGFIGGSAVVGLVLVFVLGRKARS